MTRCVELIFRSPRERKCERRRETPTERDLLSFHLPWKDKHWGRRNKTDRRRKRAHKRVKSLSLSPYLSIWTSSELHQSGRRGKSRQPIEWFIKNTANLMLLTERTMLEWKGSGDAMTVPDAFLPGLCPPSWHSDVIHVSCEQQANTQRTLHTRHRWKLLLKGHPFKSTQSIVYETCVLCIVLKTHHVWLPQMNWHVLCKQCWGSRQYQVFRRCRV